MVAEKTYEFGSMKAKRLYGGRTWLFTVDLPALDDEATQVLGEVESHLNVLKGVRVERMGERILFTFDRGVL